MAIPYFPHRRSGENLFGGRSVDEAADAARDQVVQAESCVREHPESSVWTAFGSGLILGAALGFLIASRREPSWTRQWAPVAEKLRSRFGWD